MAHFFTDQARIAATASRRKRAEMQKLRADIEVFTIRSANGYAWEIRRFGGIVVARDDQQFPSVAMAQAAGQTALKTFVCQS